MKIRVLAGVLLTLAVTLSVVAFPQVEAASNSWVTKAPHPEPYIFAHAQVAAGGVIYTIGGIASDGFIGDTYAYYKDTNSWLQKAPMPTPRDWLDAAVVESPMTYSALSTTAARGAVIYAIGGYGGSTLLATNEAYYPATDTWMEKAPMHVAREDMVAVAVNGVVYAIGGWVETPINDVTGVVEAYYPATDSWVFKRPMPTPRAEFMAAVVNGVIYAIGGYDNYVNNLRVVEAYYPQTNSWVRKRSMPVGACCGGVGVVENVIFVFGGNDGSDWVDITQAYYFRTNSWVQKMPMPTARGNMRAAVVDGVAYVIGGTPYTNVNEAYYYR